MNSKKRYDLRSPIYMKGYIILARVKNKPKGELAFQFFLTKLKECKNLKEAIEKTKIKFNIKMVAEEKKNDDSKLKKTYVIWVD